MYDVQRHIQFFNMPSYKAEGKVQKAGRTVGEEIGKNIKKCSSSTFPNIKKHGEAEMFNEMNNHVKHFPLATSPFGV